MRLIAVVLMIIIAAPARAISAAPYVIVLGTGQDAGVPQMGCTSPFCREAWNNRKLREMVSSIALVDPGSRKRWIFDATPDLPEQFEMLKAATGDRTNRLDGILITHAHIGHYTGLMYLGRESMNTSGTIVFAMPRMRQMLETNAPWSQLVGMKNILIREMADRTKVQLNSRLSVEPFLVPHRDEFSETVGFRIRSSSKSLVFIPDIDKWSKWDTRLADVVLENDYLLIDGTFFKDGEINRPMTEVPHPFVTETIDLLRGLPRSERSKVWFTHFNHSNPIVQRNAGVLREVSVAGFRVAKRGLRLYL